MAWSNQQSAECVCVCVYIPRVGEDDPSLLESCSWLPLGVVVSEWALLVREREGFSSLLVHPWSSVWLLWFCWLPWGHNVGATGQCFWAQASLVLSGSFLTVSVPMWLTRLGAGMAAGSGGVLGFSLCCSSVCLHTSDGPWQSTGPLALGGWPCSAKGPLGFLQFWQGVVLHLQTPSSAGASRDRTPPCGLSGVLRGLEQGSGEAVLPNEAWVFMSSDVTHDLALAFCSESHSADNVTTGDSVDEAFCLVDRCRMMLHWRAMTSWSHCSTHKNQA